jgi:hypothetical protein
MASNTQIFIKRSEANSAPGSLNAGELAYSYASNTLFIGANTATGPGYYKIGGQFYTNIIDQATSSNTANTLVYRDLNGDFAAGNVTAAYFIGDGSALTGLVTNLTVDGDTGGPNTIHLLTDTLTIAGGEGLTSNVDGNTITLDVDDTVIRANTEMPGTSQHIQTDLQISGNLTVQGNTTFVNTAIYRTVDSLIELAANNTTGDVVDIGFYALHGNTTTAGVDITGLVRNAGTSDYYLFDRVNIGDETDITANSLAQAFTSANSASLYVNKILANQSLGYTEGGFSFSGTEGGLDTGMFSPSDGELELWSNDQRIITANTSAVFFQQDLKLQNAATINNPNGLLELNPNETNVDDRYIVIDPTSTDHIHLRAGGSINSSTADLFLGGEYNYVKVSDASANVEISTDGRWAWQFTNTGRLQLANGTSIYDSSTGFFVDPIRANNAVGGNVTAYNTTTKELVHTDVVINNSGITLANGTVISDGEAGFFVDSLAYDAAPLDSANIVLYNASTGEITYGPIGDLNPAQIANGSHSWTVSADTGALYSDLGTALACSANSVVIGQNVDLTNGNEGRVALGEYAGQISQAAHTVAIGSGAAANTQDISAIAIGQDAGANTQQFSAVAVGRWAGQNNQGWDSVAVGRRAGRISQGDYSVAMGWGAGVDYQGAHSVAIGEAAGAGHQSAYAVAVGSAAGNTGQSWGATAIGTNAGTSNQDLVATAVGSNAGRWNQGQGAVAVGRRAGENTQGFYSVAIGNRAGASSQGDYAIAIGAYASPTGQSQNSIVLNASGSTLNGGTSGFFVNPVAYTETQDATYDGLMFYNSNSKEIRYSYTLDGGSF